MAGSWTTFSVPNTSSGSFSADIMLLLTDGSVLVHGWDLAMANGQDYALDPQLMEACRQIIEPQLEAFRSAGAFGPEVAVPAGASTQTRFLALLGRTG